jgi:Proprotein convertase P-domain
MNVDHNFLNDVIATLVSPDGTRVRLVSFVPFITGSFTNTTFDDDAPISIDDASPNYTGSFRPEELLAQLNGTSADGTWTLELEDAFPLADDGVLHNWALNLETSPDRATTTDALGNYVIQGVSPGTYHVIVVAPSGFTPFVPASGIATGTLAAGGTAVSNFALQDVVAPQIIDVVAHWGIQAMSILNLTRALPWTSMSSIDVVFSENVQVAPSFFSLVGTKFGSYPFSMTYNPSTHTATLRIAATTAFGLDKVTLGVMSDAAHHTGVQDNPGGVPGNFLQGGSFSHAFYVLPGDVDGSGAVNTIDALNIRTDIAMGVYDPFADLDGDGVITTIDFNNARSRNGTKKA